MNAQVETKSVTARYTMAVPLVFVAGLIAYKWNAASAVIQKVWASGAISVRTDVVVFGGATTLKAAEHALNYFVVIWPALAFGILISAAVRAFIPAEWFLLVLRRRSMGTQIASGLAGAPLMLCSCCVAAVFTTVYERSSRLGPALAIMLASPALNPAALVLTFLLFLPKLAVARLAMAIPAVFLSGIVIEWLLPRQTISPKPVIFDKRPAFTRALIDVILRTVPALILGVICSMLLIEYVPAPMLASPNLRSLAVIASASIAVPIALPTFFEIPLALSLVAAGAPAGAAAALLFAGPVINLPSLLTLAKSTNWKIAAALAGLIWMVAVIGGLIVNQIAS